MAVGSVLIGLHAWRADPSGQPERFYEVVHVLVAAGAAVSPDLLEEETIRADRRMMEALTRS